MGIYGYMWIQVDTWGYMWIHVDIWGYMGYIGIHGIHGIYGDIWYGDIHIIISTYIPIYVYIYVFPRISMP